VFISLSTALLIPSVFALGMLLMSDSISPLIASIFGAYSIYFLAVLTAGIGLLKNVRWSRHLSVVVLVIGFLGTVLSIIELVFVSIYEPAFVSGWRDRAWIGLVGTLLIMIAYWCSVSLLSIREKGGSVAP
jgi:hypothetical protein